MGVRASRNPAVETSADETSIVVIGHHTATERKLRAVAARVFASPHLKFFSSVFEALVEVPWTSPDIIVVDSLADALDVGVARLRREALVRGSDSR